MEVHISENLHERLQDLLTYIQEGRILEAINEFYAEDTKMQENTQPPTVGRQANLQREQAFLSTVKEWKRFDVTAQGVGEDVTFYETVMEWVTTDGTSVHVEQVVVAKWQDGKITHERYYHNP